MTQQLVDNAQVLNETFRDVLVLELTLQLRSVLSGGKGELEHLIDKLNETRHGDVIVSSNHRRMSNKRLEDTGRYDILTAINYMTIAHHGGEFRKEETLHSLQVSLSKRLVWLARQHPKIKLFVFEPERLLTHPALPKAA